MSVVPMPQLGESVSEGTVVRWLKRVGEPVAIDEPLFEVASDKVNMEIPSLSAGVLAEILVPEGATVDVGTAIARIEASATVAAGAPAANTPSGADGRMPPPARRNPSSENGRVHNGARSHLFSPVVRRLAREHNLDLARIAGSGRGGRITRSDVLGHMARADTAPQPQAVSAPQPLAAPERLTGASSPPIAPPPSVPASQPRVAAVPGSGTPMSPMRVRIAENVLASKRAVADVFSVFEADMENVHAARLAHRDAFKAREGIGLTYLPFIALATIDALRAFPAVNARIDGTSLVYNADVHVGIAVDLDERGLVVPVIRNANDRNLTGIAKAIVAMSAAARAGTASSADLSGSTFTITNNGTFGSLMTGAIINQPNVAILSTDAIEERVVPYHGMIAIRRRMNLCMTWDHRAFDGSTAGKFLARVKHDLETRDWTNQL